MIIIGIDPGSRKLGYGLVDKQGRNCHHVENGTLYLEDKGELPLRLVHLHAEILRLIKKFGAEMMAIENIFYHKNPRSMQKLGEVRGVAMHAAASLGLGVFEYAPLVVKKAVCGYGGASKEQMQAMVRTLLGLRDPAEENASDALGIAWCHAHSIDKELAAGPYVKNSVRSRGRAPAALTPAREILRKASFYR